MTSLPHLRDKSLRTVLVHAIMREGRLVNLYTGNALPTLREGALVQLRMLEVDFLNKDQLRVLTVQDKVEMLPTGTQIFIMLNADRVRREDRKKLGQIRVHSWASSPPCHGAIVYLAEPLSLRLNGSKKGSLCSARCVVHDLGGVRARSLNHAYTLLSKEFEQERLSYGGNVFEVAFAYVRNQWYSLGTIREAVMAQHERQIMTELGIEDVDARINEILMAEQQNTDPHRHPTQQCPPKTDAST